MEKELEDIVHNLKYAKRFFGECSATPLSIVNAKQLTGSLTYFKSLFALFSNYAQTLEDIEGNKYYSAEEVLILKSIWFNWHTAIDAQIKLVDLLNIRKSIINEENVIHVDFKGLRK